jgi:hypothetical protein
MLLTPAGGSDAENSLEAVRAVRHRYFMVAPFNAPVAVTQWVQDYAGRVSGRAHAMRVVSNGITDL